MTSSWARWRLKSPASPLFTQPFIWAQIKENIKAPRHWPLCGEFTWSPPTKCLYDGCKWSGAKLAPGHQQLPHWLYSDHGVTWIILTTNVTHIALQPLNKLSSLEVSNWLVSLLLRVCLLTLLIVLYMMTSSNRDIFRVTGPLWGEFIGDRLVPRTKGQ